MTKCDCCGQFMNPGKPGSSWCEIPDSDYSNEEIIWHCYKCTHEFGIPCSNQLGCAGYKGIVKDDLYENCHENT